jgi:hypothetical protein
MITGDLVKHKIDPNSFGVIMKVGALGAKVLWLDEDHPMVESYPKSELIVTSSADLDWENDNVISGS